MIKTPSNVLFLGVSGSGKTNSFNHVFKSICTNFTNGICFSSTADLTDDYKFMPENKIYTKYDERIVTLLMEEQHEHISLAKKRGKKCTREVFIILDDCLGVIDFHHSIFNELFSKSRHLNISVFVLIQHANSISPVMRLNTRYTFVTKIKDNNVKALFQLVNDFENEKDLKAFLKEYCVNYQTILFDDYDVYIDQSQKIKIFKFPGELPNYRLVF